MKSKRLRIAMTEVLLEMEDILLAAKTSTIVAEKWVAKLILELRAYYILTKGRAPDHIYIPPEYLEKLLLESPGSIHATRLSDEGAVDFLRVYGMEIISKSANPLPPFDMWETDSMKDYGAGELG